LFWAKSYKSSIRKEVKGMKGKIKKIMRERGFGFITEEGGREIFFHRSALVGTDFDALQGGTSVEFDAEKGPKGLRAVNIHLIKA
jgi:CspA family cold shock protein